LLWTLGAFWEPVELSRDRHTEFFTCRNSTQESAAMLAGGTIDPVVGNVRCFSV
jgi:hypothetical protein